VSNGGGGTLDGLGVTVRYDSGQPVGWLNVSIGAGTAPTTISAQPVTGSLSAGTYGATIDVTSSQASNSPQTIDVTFTVNAAPTPPSISLSTTSLSFQATAGGANPSATSVSVSNGGGGTLGGLGVTVRYDSGQPVGWLNVSIGAGTAPTTISAQPVTGSLSAGTYGATIDVTSSQASNSPRTIDVTFTVEPGLQPPTAPVLVKADVRKNHVQLDWEDRSSNETSFVVQRTQRLSSGWNAIATLPAGTKSYKDTDIDDDETYFYRIEACNAAGCSTSNVIEVEIDD
jgi:hypothetical protein